MAKPPGKSSSGSMAGMSHGRRDGGPHGASDGGVHIRSMSTCSMLGGIKKGDKIHIEANYDYTKFPGLKSTEIMGIAILYAAMDMPSPAEAVVATPAKATTPKADTAPKGGLKGLLSSGKGNVKSSGSRV